MALIKWVMRILDRRAAKPYVDSEYYLAANSDVASSSMDPLDHYIRYGWKEGRNPSRDFDSTFYLAHYPDVAASGMNPLLHYARFGRREGRLPAATAPVVAAPAQIAAAIPDISPPIIGQPEITRREITQSDLAPPSAREIITPHFDKAFYLATYHDVREAGLAPVDHYIEFGWKEGRQPTPDFSTAFYLAENPDVTASGMNPFEHYLLHGKDEGRPASSPIIDLLALKPVAQAWQPSVASASRYDISVIIPTYNRAHMLPSLLDAWRAAHDQTRYSYELIFSDDGSSDDTLAVLEAAAQDLPITLLRNAHGGASSARNAAVRIAQGAKILFAGDDIYPEPNLLNLHVEKLRELPITHAVLGECGWHPGLEVNHLMKHITEIGCEQFSFLHLPRGGFTDFRHFYTCNVSIDRAFLLSEEVIFDERFNKYGFEDVELGYRLARKGMQIFYLPEAWGDHYHSYTDVRKFCVRQECAGEMAKVFEEMHPELGHIIPLAGWEKQWAERVALGLTRDFDFYGTLEALCQESERRRDELTPAQLESLSRVYARLFSFAFEMGYARVKIAGCTAGIINQAVCEAVLDNAIFAELSVLNKRLQFAVFPQLVQMRSQAPSQAHRADVAPARGEHKRAKPAERSARIIVQGDDLEQLAVLQAAYAGLEGPLVFALKSDTPLDGLIYAPSGDHHINRSNLAQLLLFSQFNPDVDQIVLSFGLHELPEIGVKPGHGLITIARPGVARRGKVVRLFGEGEVESRPLESLLGPDVRLADHYGNFFHQGAA